MDLQQYWRTARRRWRVVASCLLVAVALAAVVTWQATPQYASSARLFVSTSPSDTADAYQGELFASQRVTSYADLVATRDLAVQVSDSLAADGTEVSPDDLRDGIQASVVPETVILEITATDPDPLLARDVAQSYAEELTTRVTALESGDDRSPRLIRISVVDDATVTDDPVSPQPWRNVGLAVLLGLMVGGGLAVARELLDTSVRSPEDVAAITPAPVVGSIVADVQATRPDRMAALGDSTAWAEAFRVLRTNLQYLRVDSDHKVVVVSSAVPAEGKTTVATDLAVSLAQAGHRVALIECDLRRPQIARRLGLDDATGTTTVLIGAVTLDQALQPYGEDGLMVLTSGPIPPNPSELLQSRAMADLLDELRRRFEVVLIDVPPLLPVTDAAPLAAQGDGAVLVVRHARTSRDQLTHAVGRLDAVGASTLGVVLTMVPSQGRESGYGYGYGYGGYGPPPAEPVATGPRRAAVERARDAVHAMGDTAAWVAIRLRSGAGRAVQDVRRPGTRTSPR